MLVVLTLLFVLSGAAGLFYESVWSRYLGLFVGHNAYAQVIVLVIFLGGMALGALLVGRFTRRIKEPLFAYALVEGRSAFLVCSSRTSTSASPTGPTPPFSRIQPVASLSPSPSGVSGLP